MFDYSTLESLKKKNISAPWPKGLLIFFVFLFLLVLGLNFFLKFYLSSQERQLNSLNTKLKDLRSSISQEKEEEILKLEKKINKLDLLLANHLYFSTFFEWLEKYTHPDIYYDSLNYSVDNRKVSLFGYSKDNQSLVEGLGGGLVNKMLSSVELIEGIVLKTLEPAEGGEGKRFSLEIYLRPSGLLFNSQLHSENSELQESFQNIND